ncbi:MAG: glycoside hydrolase family 3 C-terminal domain-containing protein [Candidatus Lokiarchaeota archaeon]|nr:glycoside hydrolase family 3 C-terminal domain-containing protein [Candidatus Lokiarchaeota archaeon]
MAKEPFGSIDWTSLRDLGAEEVEAHAKRILGRMTLLEKLNQLTGNWTLLQGAPMLFRYNSKPIPAGRDKRLGIPGVLFTDGPRGIVMGASTCFPVSMARGATWDTDLEERVGSAIGAEARAQGANLFAGVCINLLRHPAWGRAQETYGEDPFLLGAMGTALARGVQSMGVMACAKHYACNSMENMRFKVNVKIDDRTLHEVYLPHFKRCVDEGIAAIMSAYNKVNGEHCGHNKVLLRDILKSQWGFAGLVMSDFIWGVRDGEAALKGGLDIEMPFRLHMKPKKMAALVQAGKIDPALVDDAALRVLRQQLRFNMATDPGVFSLERVGCAEHVALAKEVAQKAIVLLKNDGGILPFSIDGMKQLAVFGRLAREENLGDHGSSRVRPRRAITPLEGLKAVARGRIAIVHDDGKDVGKASRIAGQSDACVVVSGLTWKEEGEYIASSGGDRRSLGLHPADVALIQAVSEANKRVALVLEGGSALITEDVRGAVPAMLMAWYPGMEGGSAIADVIFGEVNPSGKLPVTFPRSPDQLPFFDRSAKEIDYGYYHGYKLLDKNRAEPAFPFGHGSSYATFELSNARLDSDRVKQGGEIRVQVDVRNAGTIAGDEIVQAYVGYDAPALDRPVKELKGFARIHVGPGEARTASIPIRANDLAYYDPGSKSWKHDSCQHAAFVASSSDTSGASPLKFTVVP